MAAYYNEIDPKAAAWLRELIQTGLIANGEVDERSIVDVRAGDLAGYRQCHFFAGIGGWSYALRLANWPDDRAVWTGSCPCQPFSAAGKGDGADDSRHLWPAWFELVKECRPAVVFGEQVASADGLGWLDRVSADLEAEDYAIGAVDLGAAGFGAFHIRQRLWFVAHTESSGAERLPAERRVSVSDGHGCGEVGDMADTSNTMRRPFAEHRTDDQQEIKVGSEGASDARERGTTSALDDAERERAGRSAGRQGCPQRPPHGAGEDEGRRVIQTLDSGAACYVGHAEGERPQREWSQQSATIVDERGRFAGLPGVSWTDADWLPCIDGKARPVEPGTFPLAHGIPARVGRLRGYGNAIVPQVAQAFIEAYLEASA